MITLRPAFCLAILAVPLAANAQALSGPYVSLGGGVDVLQNENVQPDGIGPNPRSYTFDPGGAAEASLGYGFGNGLRVEAQGDYADTHVHGVLIPVQFQGLRAGGFQQQYGGFGNVLYDFRLGLPVTPYLGLGAGYQEIELDHINSSDYGVRDPGLPNAETRGNFDYQGIAGLSLSLPVRGLSLTLEYRLIGVLTPGAYYRGSANELILVPPKSTTAPNQLAPFGLQGYIPASQLPTVETIRVAEHAIFNNIFNHEVLFGLRYAFNSAPPPPPSGSIPAPAPEPEAARIYLVFFDWDSAILTPHATEIVDEAARSARVHVTSIEVDGYADTSHALPRDRGQRYNLRLSHRRADRVREELIRRGVSANAIEVQAFGDTHLLVPTGPDVREPQNRRVEIILR